MFSSASLFFGTSFTIAVFTIFATSNVDSIVGIPHKIYSMQRILLHIKSRCLCYMCPSAPRVCSEPGGQKPVLSLSLDLIHTFVKFYPFSFIPNVSISINLLGVCFFMQNICFTKLGPFVRFFSAAGHSQSALSIK